MKRKNDASRFYFSRCEMQFSNDEIDAEISRHAHRPGLITRLSASTQRTGWTGHPLCERANEKRRENSAKARSPLPFPCLCGNLRLEKL
jgi:hypothetical protein